MEIRYPAESVAAWREILAALDEAGAAVADLAGNAPAIDVAEGFGYVLDVLSDQVERAAMRRSRRPFFVPAIMPVRKLFFDNPDTSYDLAVLDGDQRYRIRGQLGTSIYLAFSVYSGAMSKGQSTRVANLADKDMRIARDGTFEVTLSPDETPGNWIRLDPDAHTIIVRQYFLDRTGETPARYDIERLGETVTDPPLDDVGFAHTARSAARFVIVATSLARRRADARRGDPNRFVEVAGHGAYGTPDADYVACWYRLADDEALVVDVQPPECRYWGVHLANRWGQSLDYRTRSGALNARTVTPNDDGSVRIVVSEKDPDVPNWLDTAGHCEGWVLLRWLLAKNRPVPHAELVETASLGGRVGKTKDR